MRTLLGYLIAFGGVIVVAIGVWLLIGLGYALIVIGVGMIIVGLVYDFDPARNSVNGGGHNE